MKHTLTPREIVVLYAIISDLERQQRAGELALIPPNAEKIIEIFNDHGKKTGSTVEIGILGHPSQVTIAINELRKAKLIHKGKSRTKDAIRPTPEAVQLVEKLRADGYFGKWGPGKYAEVQLV